METGFLFENDVVCIKCNNFNTAVEATTYTPVSGSFIDMAGIDHGVFLIGVGTLDSALTVAVYEDTSATVTAGVQAISGLSQVIGATDDNKWLTIEFNANQMDRADGYRYVTLYTTGGSGSNDYMCVFFLGFRNSKAPVTKNASYAYHVASVS